LRPSFFLSKARSTSAQFKALFRILLLGLFAQAAVLAVNAQTPPVEARVASVSGSTIRSSTLSPAQPVQRGDVLSPGDEIDTRGGGHVVIELSDGSVVIVQPGSHILFQDYRAAGTLFELFEIMVGRVRFRINHFSGKPNPYRVNSPTASIAVRGTEFSVAVQESGATEVTVYAGLIEVTSLNSPGQTVLVGPGRSVIVRTNADILFFETGSEEHGRDGHRGGKRDTTDAAFFYEQYSESLTETAETPEPSRFAAFSDPHLDSIENPAYATEFSMVEGRLLLLPSLSGPPRDDTNGAPLGSISKVPISYSVSPQGSFFVPLHQSHSVVGGSFAASRDGLQSLSVYKRNVHSGFPLGVTAVSGSTENTYLTGSLIAAHTFGSSQRTSLGLAFAQTWEHGTLLNAMAQTDQTGLMPGKRFDSRSHIRLSEIDTGLTHVFSGGHKFGVVYRYSILSADEHDRSNAPNTLPLALDSTQESGFSSELDVRLRGPVTRRLFYGLEVALLLTNQDEKVQPAKGVDVSGLERTRRGVASVGLGYAPSRRILLAVDIASGSSWTRDRQHESVIGNLLEDSRGHMHYLSSHAALQTDIWRSMFASASILSVTQASQSQLMAGRIEPLLTSVGQGVPKGMSRNHFTDYSSDFGIGWRFSPSFLAQYIYSTDYGLTSPRHTLMLRHSFRLGRE
jgi:FecR protein